MSLWKKLEFQNKVDNHIIKTLADISYESTKGRRQKRLNTSNDMVELGKLPFLETPPPTQITKDMILDYQKSLETPFIDPVTNKPFIDPATGQPILNRYVPADFQLDIADLKRPPTLENDLHLKDAKGNPRPAKEKDVNNYDIAIKRLFSVTLNRSKIQYEQNLNLLNDLNIKLNTQPLTAAEKLKTENDIKRVEGLVQKSKQDIDTATQTINDEIIKKEDAIRNIQANKNIITIHNLEIKKDLEKYRHSLQTVNKNRISLVQQPNETEEEFLLRMKDIEAEKFDMNIYEEKAKLNQIIILKKNLRDLFNKNDLIENIVKSFTGEQIFIINKHFPEIREYFLETYGKNNTNLLLKDIIDIMIGILEKILNPQIEYELEEEPPPPAPTTPFTPTTIKDAKTGTDTNYQVGLDNNAFYIGNDKNGNHVWFNTAAINGKQLLLYSTGDNTRGNFTQVMKNDTTGTNPNDLLTNIIDKYLKLDAVAKKEILPKNYTKLNTFISHLEANGLKPLKEGIKIKKETGFGKKVKRYGAGLKDPEEELPEYTEFGNLIIMLRKLYYKNILSLKMKSGHKIEGLKNAKVSNLFVDIIMDMYNNKNVSSLMKNLKTDEKHLMDSIIYYAGLHKKIPTDISETIATLKNKYKLIEGEITAGNNAYELKKQLKDVLMQLYHLGAISVPALNKYLKQF